MVSVERKGVGSVGCPGQWEPPLSCLQISGVILQFVGRGGSKCMPVWLADQGSPIFLRSLLGLQKLEGEGLEHLKEIWPYQS